MIPSNIRLYTWIDVEDVLLRIQKEKKWPEWLVWGRAYFDGLHLGIRKGTQNEAKKWLAEQFAPRINIKDDEILLESSENQPRTLPIFWEETDETPPVPRTVPSLARPTVISRPYERHFPEPLPEEYPPIIAFHSFKGGVGRTPWT